MLRMATDEEREQVKQISPISDDAMVFADDLGNIAAINKVVEIEPIVKGSGKKGFAEFVASLELLLAQTSIPEYYFSVAADNEQFLIAAEKWGADKVFEAPVYRCVRRLVKDG